MTDLPETWRDESDDEAARCARCVNALADEMIRFDGERYAVCESCGQYLRAARARRDGHVAR